jgi:SAM-dependent methyltransferase
MPFIDGIFFAYRVTAALKAAIELDLFTAIAEGADTIETLAPRIGAAPRGARILADFLTVRGFIEKADGRYRLTPDSAAFLDRRSPAFMGMIGDFLAAPEHLAITLEDPAARVRAGGSAGLAHMAPDNPIWVKFARAMVPFIMPAAQGVAERVAAWPTPPRRVLDVAAGHGMFGILVAKAVPAAEVTAVDWGGVLAVAHENAAAAGVAERYRTRTGSAFDTDWGGGYDLVLLPNFLHHFDAETCATLLRKVRASLAPGGRVVAVEMVPNEDRISPPGPAMFALVMLINTPAGDAYTQAELEAMGREAGFRGIATEPLAPSPETLVEFLT